MKRHIGIILVSLLTCASISPLIAEEISTQELDKKISGQIMLKYDLYKPLNGKRDFSEVGIYVYGHYKFINDFGVGVGLDQGGGTHGNYWLVRPFVTINKGPYYLVAGYSTETHGSGHVQVGTWYVNQFGKWDVFLDIRYYSRVKGGGSDFIDCFVSVHHPLPFNEKFFAGIEGDYAQSLGKNRGTNWSFVGPVIGYKFTKNVSFFVRPAICWDNCPGRHDQQFYLRTGLSFVF